MPESERTGHLSRFLLASTRISQLSWTGAQDSRLSAISEETATETMSNYRPFSLCRSAVAVLVFIGFLVNLQYGLQLIRVFLAPEDPCSRDFAQFYLAGRALLSGEAGETYVALPLLGAKFEPSCAGSQLLVTPTPYSPFALMVLSPLALLDIHDAGLVWAALSAVLLVAGLRLAWKDSFEDAATARLWPFAVIAALGFSPVQIDIALGNLNCLALALLCVGRRKLRAANNLSWITMLLIALALSLKFWGWLFLLLLFLRGQQKSGLRILALFALYNAVPALIWGPGIYEEWIRHGLAECAEYYSHALTNQSLLTLAPRLFRGMEHGAVPPLISAPILSAPTALVVLTVLSSLFISRTKDAPWDRAWLICFPLGMLLQPIAWIHYTMVALPLLLTMVSEWLRSQTARPFPWQAAAFACMGIFWEQLQRHGGVPMALPGLLTSLLNLFPAASVLLLCLSVRPASQRTVEASDAIR